MKDDPQVENAIVEAIHLLSDMKVQLNESHRFHKNRCIAAGG
jgi:hypothetical protein